MRITAAVRGLVILLAGLCAAAQAGTVYVSTFGNDSNNGQSWAAAKKTVQAGLNAAVSGDQVWVAAGTYIGCITLKDGVALYGGFSGSETSLTQRNWSSNVAVLDGNQSGSVVTAPTGVTLSARIDGFTIRNGMATQQENWLGGGICCVGASPTIVNNTITGNTAVCGGGIACSSSSSPTITNNMITDNEADDWSAARGGGIYCQSSSPVISGNTITGNVAGSTEWSPLGGGICCYLSSNATITNNTIANNRAGWGGGICCDSQSSPTISQNTITGNTVYSSGGGISSSFSAPTIANNSVSGNSAYSGGGILVYGVTGAPVTVVNNTVVANGAESGGGVCCMYASPVIANSIIAFNSSGIYNDTGSPVLRSNCTYGNAMYDYSGVANPTGTNGNISVDPKLPSTSYGKLHIQANSPCVGAGDNSFVQAGWVDIDGQARIVGARVDIGDDESDGTVWPSSSGIVIRVRSDGDDAHDGSSWTLAKRTVQAGINAAASPQGQVWVARGTYVENVTLAREMAVYGGFAGTETNLSQRNWVANVTVLDGGRNGYVVTGPVGATATTRIDGFVIRNGMLQNTDGYPLGGGIYCLYSSLTIANNTITGNSGEMNGEGAIYCSSACPVIVNNAVIGNNTVMANRGDCSEGAIHCTNASPAIINNTIVGNCGGISCRNSSPTIVNTIVAFNSFGIYCDTSTPSLRCNCIYGNATANYVGLADPTGTGGNIAADPRLAAVAYGNAHIQPTSACIDAGDDSVVQAGWNDMDCQSRILGSHVDIGADESDGTTWPTSPNAIIRVAAEGDDARDGSSWNLAKQTIQAGIEAAAGLGGDVWVKAGTYAESISLRNYVHVYGGFAGMEMDRSARDSARNITILDGSQSQDAVTAQYLGSVSTLDGFTLRNAARAVYCEYSSPKIANNTFTGNTRVIYCYCASPVISNNTMSDNTMVIDCENSSPMIADNQITNNVGDGIVCNYSPFPLITRNTISGSNWANGCGVYCSQSSPTIAFNTISDNSGLGGIYIHGSSPKILCNMITGNRASRQGGGIYCYLSAAMISGNVISGNSAPSGGGIYYAGEATIPTITMNTVVGNQATEGGGIYADYGAATVTNTIVAFNSSGIFAGGQSTPVLRYSCVFGNTSYDFSGLANPTGTNGNISLDPAFVQYTAPYNLHLVPGSRCINVGDPAYVPAVGETDMDGQPRKIGARVDIGADEFCLTGDANYDGYVNVGDLQLLVAAWGTCKGDASYNAAADFNGDGYVNVGDLQLFVAHWGGSM